jgi:hypothetical protein
MTVESGRLFPKWQRVFTTDGTDFTEKAGPSSVSNLIDEFVLSVPSVRSVVEPMLSKRIDLRVGMSRMLTATIKNLVERGVDPLIDSVPVIPVV